MNIYDEICILPQFYYELKSGWGIFGSQYYNKKRDGIGSISVIISIWKQLKICKLSVEGGREKISQIPTCSGLCGFVRNRGKFPQISVHFAVCGFAGSRGRMGRLLSWLCYLLGQISLWRLLWDFQGANERKQPDLRFPYRKF